MLRLCGYVALLLQVGLEPNKFDMKTRFSECSIQTITISYLINSVIFSKNGGN